MLICGLLSLLVSPIDTIDSIFLNFYTQTVMIFGLYNLIQEIREAIRINKLGLPKAEYYLKYRNGYRPRICTITDQLVWKKKHDVIAHRNNDELAKQLIEHNLTTIAELEQLGFICQKSGRVMAYPTRVLRACDINGLLGRIKIDKNNSELVYRFEGSVIAKDAVLVGENPLNSEQKIRLPLRGGSIRDGQGYSYKAGDVILDTALHSSIEAFFAAKIEELTPLLPQEQERRPQLELQVEPARPRGSSSQASIDTLGDDRSSVSTRELLLYSHSTPAVSHDELDLEDDAHAPASLSVSADPRPSCRNRAVGASFK